MKIDPLDTMRALASVKEMRAVVYSLYRTIEVLRHERDANPKDFADRYQGDLLETVVHTLEKIMDFAGVDRLDAFQIMIVSLDGGAFPGRKRT